MWTTYLLLQEEGLNRVTETLEHDDYFTSVLHMVCMDEGHVVDKFLKWNVQLLLQHHVCQYKFNIAETASNSLLGVAYYLDQVIILTVLTRLLNDSCAERSFMKTFDSIACVILTFSWLRDMNLVGKFCTVVLMIFRRKWSVSVSPIQLQSKLKRSKLQW